MNYISLNVERNGYTVWYIRCGSATRVDLSSCWFGDWGVGLLAGCWWQAAVGLISSPSAVSSCFGVSSAVILRSRAAGWDLRAFSSFSLPQVLAMMASSLAVQGRRISLIWNNTYLILSIISLLLMKKFSRMLLITSRT